MSIKVKTGDVFLLPVDGQLFGLGQVAYALPAELYLVTYEGVWDKHELPDAYEVIGKKPHFATLSLDAKLWNGDWTIIGNVVENLSDIRLPCYKVNQNGELMVESLDRQQLRIATAEEAELLRFRKTVAPVRLERAVQADQGVGEWLPAFDELEYSYCVLSSQIDV